MNGKRILACLITLALVITDLNLVKAAEMNTTNVPVAANETVDATGATEYTSSDGRFKFTLDSTYNCYATITAYLGNESNVNVPPTITCSTGTYIVKAIGDSAFGDNSTVVSITVAEGIVNIGQAFCGCSNLKVVTLPSSTAYVPDEAFNESYKLESINVLAGGERYFSRNGVLFYNKDNELILETYPEGKAGTSYIIDNDIAGIKPQAFLYSQNLQSISIPGTIKYVLMCAFDTPANPLTIYFNPETLDIINKGGNFAGEAFYGLKSGSKIIAKNTAMANEIPIHMSNCTGTTVIDMSQDASYQKPVTSFTFSDGSTTKDLTFPISKTDESLLTSYTVTPADTTDNVTWTSSNTNIATVDPNTGSIDTKAPGDCIITGIVGAPGNQHTVTLNLRVYQAITDVELFCNSSNPTTYTAKVGDDKKYIGFITTPNRASNWDKTVWSSSNPAVATVEKDETDKAYAQLSFLSPGQTTITATINDDGTIWTKSFILNVTKPPVNISALSASIESQTYNGAALTPNPIVTDGTTRLVYGTDYIVSYANNIKAGAATATATITGIGNYTGSKPVRFTIKKADIDTRGIQWSDTARSFTGKNHVVSLQNLPVGVSATYSNNKKKTPGKYTTVATLSYDTSNYNIPKTTTFSTNWYIRNDQKINFSSKNISGTTIKVTYGTADFNLGTSAKTKLSYASGNNKITTVDGNGNISIKGTGYTTITVTAKKTDTYNIKTVVLKIYVTPKQSAITSLKSNKKSELTVQWSKDKRATGYQIQYSTSNKFKGNTTNSVLVNKNKTTAQKVKGLKKGKTYYVRVRAYKTVNENGADVIKYGKWSSTQTVKVSKR